MELGTLFDQVAYPAKSHIQSQPDRLATMARMAGFLPAPVSRCRYLELGCGQALGLIAVAYAWPECECVGIDLSAAAIGRGRRMVEQLGLKNVRLIAGDLASVDFDQQRFDYIAAHGLYSWVPPAIADAALNLCGRLLADNGFAYFSYDVFPGGFLKQMTRELMYARLGGRSPRDLSDVKLARSGIDQLIASAPNESWAAMLRYQAERLRLNSDEVLFHDDLTPDHHVVWFDAFAEHAAGHGLKFVSEADPLDVLLPKLSNEARLLIQQMSGTGDVIARERATDIVRGRFFRQSILARASASAQAEPLSEQSMSTIYLSAKLRAEPDKIHRGATTFYGPVEGSVTLIDPSAVACLHVLARAWPATVLFTELRREAAAHAGVIDDSHHAAIVLDVIKGVSGVRLAELSSAPPPCATSLESAGLRPRVSQMARLAAQTGEMVTTLVGRRIDVRGDVARQFLQLLDGTHTREELYTAMQALAQHAGATVSPDQIEGKLRDLIETRLIHAGDPQ